MRAAQEHKKNYKTNKTPSNLKSTTRDCVQLVTRGHFRSVKKMAVTPFDLPYPKTPSCTQTSRLNRFFL